MNDKKLVCPACDSEDVVQNVDAKTYVLPYANPFSVPNVTNTCKVCGESGDFLKANDSAYEVAEKVALTDSVNRILDDMSAEGVSMAYIERVLQLPKRTLHRWKSGSDSATGIALLRLVRTCPWLLEIAKENYSPMAATRVVVTQAGNLLAQAISNNTSIGTPHSV